MGYQVQENHLFQIIYLKINNSILIDGDLVRKYISTDLGYAKKDRNTNK